MTNLTILVPVTSASPYRPLIMPTAIGLLFLCAAALSAQTVEGTVVDTVTGEGIAEVKVELFRLMGPPATDPQADRMNTILATMESEPAYGATTDRQGRFRIEGVLPGTYGPRFRSADHIDEAVTVRSLEKGPRKILVSNGN